MAELNNIISQLEDMVSVAEKVHFLGNEIHDLHTPISTGNEREDVYNFYYNRNRMEMMSNILSDYSLELSQTLIKIADSFYKSHRGADDEK